MPFSTALTATPCITPVHLSRQSVRSPSLCDVPVVGGDLAVLRSIDDDIPGGKSPGVQMRGPAFTGVQFVGADVTTDQLIDVNPLTGSFKNIGTCDCFRRKELTQIKKVKKNQPASQFGDN